MVRNTRVTKGLAFIFLLAVIGVVAYFNRWIFRFKFEPSYWENYYYESQWNVPNSKRVISDEGVYRYIGYRLVNGENPFNVDYWVPPLGKYWYGWGAKYLHNPYLISFAYYLASIAIFWFIAKLVIKEPKAVYLSTVLFALNPLLVEQIGQTMLDLPLTVFFMLTILGLIKAGTEKKISFVIFSGVALGLMAGTKPPYFIPMIVLVGTGWLYWKKAKKLWIFPFFVVVGYLLAYTCYFLKHPNPIPFIRLHQKVIGFQSNFKGTHDWLQIFNMIFLDKFKGTWYGAKTIVPLTWSIILPIGTLALVWLVAKFKKINKENNNILLVVILGVLYVVMNFSIDFMPRYLMPMIPVLTLAVGYVFRKVPKMLVILTIGLLPSLYFLLFPSPNSFMDDFLTKKSLGLYKDTYQMLDQTSKKKIDENSWKTNEESIDVDQIMPVKEDNQWRVRVEE